MNRALDTAPHASHSREGGNPEPWSKASIGELFDFGAGKSVTPAARGGERSHPFLRTSNIFWGEVDVSQVSTMHFNDEEIEAKSLRNGDLLVCEGGDIGRSAIWNGELAVCGFQNHLHRLRAKHRDIVPRFVMYFLQAGFTQLGIYEGAGNKTTIPNLSRSRLAALEVPQPPKPEQEKIAAVLWKLQRAIATQDRLIAATRDLKQSTMQHIFTHGLRSEPLKETEIGLMPESWSETTLGKYASVGSGGTPSRTNPDYWRNGSIPWVKTGEIDYCVIEDAEEKITPLALKQSAARLFPKDTLLLAMYGQGITRGKVAILGIEAATNQACAAIRPLDDRLRNDFLYCTLTYGYERLRGLAHGGQQQNLNADLIRRFVFGLSDDLDEQRDIATVLATIDRKLAHHQRKRATLNDLFQTLLHQLMTARIRVADLDIDTSEVADHIPDVGNMVETEGASIQPDHFANAGKMVSQREKHPASDHFVDADKMIGGSPQSRRR